MVFYYVGLARTMALGLVSRGSITAFPAQQAECPAQQEESPHLQTESPGNQAEMLEALLRQETQREGNYDETRNRSTPSLPTIQLHFNRPFLTQFCWSVPSLQRNNLSEDIFITATEKYPDVRYSQTSPNEIETC
jgi:hypothetical protein